MVRWRNWEVRVMGCLPGSRDAVNDGTAKIPMPSVLERRSQRRNSEKFGAISVSERRSQRRKSQKSGAFRARETLSTPEQRKFRCLPCPKGALNDGTARNWYSSVLDKCSPSRRPFVMPMPDFSHRLLTKPKNLNDHITNVSFRFFISGKYEIFWLSLF